MIIYPFIPFKENLFKLKISSKSEILAIILVFGISMEQIFVSKFISYNIMFEIFVPIKILIITYF